MKNITRIFIVIIILFLFSGCLHLLNFPDEPYREEDNISRREDTAEKDPLSLEGLKNLIENPGFESGMAPWGPFGNCSVEVSTAQAHSGESSLYITNRQADWEGAGADIMPILKKGHTYLLSAWVKLENSSSETMKISMKSTTSQGDNYDPLTSEMIKGQDWAEIIGEYSVDPSGSFNGFTLYIEGPGPDTSFYIDDVKVAQIGPEKIFEDD